MHNRNVSKRRELLTRIAVYTLMTMAVVALVGLSLLYVLGYRFDSAKHRVEQSGLVQLVTQPSGATVEIDGSALSQKTTTKESVSPGNHEFVMWREGYETWRKTLNIKAGTLTWLNYTRLIPKERPVETVDAIATVAQALASPNDKYMAIMTDSSKPSVRFYDVSQSTVPGAKTVTIPTAVYAQAGAADVAHQFSLEAWDDSDHYMLIKHTYSKKKSVEWLVLDRDGGTTQSITQLMDVSLEKVFFTDTSGKRFVGLIDSDVRTIDIEDGTLSRPVVSDVSDIWYHYETGTVAYAERQADDTGYRTVGVVKRDHKPVTLYRSNAAATVPLTIRAARYFDQDYVAILEGTQVTVYGGSFPEDENDAMQKVTTFTAKDTVTDLQFSPTGRFVLVQQRANFETYDIERGELSAVGTLAGSGNTAAIRWIDDFRIWSDRSGELVMREFDGANEHAINTVATGLDVMLSPNDRYLYSIGKTDGGYQLQRIKMILD